MYCIYLGFCLVAFGAGCWVLFFAWPMRIVTNICFSSRGVTVYVG